MRSKRMYYTGLILGVIGIILLIILVGFGAAYPDILFKILAPTGILFAASGAIICFIGWILMVKDAMAKKSYSDVVWLLVMAMIVFLAPVLVRLFLK